MLRRIGRKRSRMPRPWGLKVGDHRLCPFMSPKRGSTPLMFSLWVKAPVAHPLVQRHVRLLLMLLILGLGRVLWVVALLLERVPWYPIPIKRKAMGRSLGWMALMAALWHCWSIGICHMLSHKIGHPSVVWANSTLFLWACGPTIMPLSGSHTPIHGLPSLSSLLRLRTNTLGMIEWSLSCILHLLSA